MRTQAFSLEIIALLVLILIPWPGPTVFKISCPRDSARIVRKLIQKKWLPVLEKRHVKLGMECPFHPSRDIFGAQQAAKQQHRPSQWACAFCGKSFYTERHLDQHFDSRHRDSINMAEDAVCLADYCDVMRCEVLAARESHSSTGGSGTDIEVWRSSHQASYTALSVSAPRDLARVTAFPSLKVPPPPPQQQQQQGQTRKQKQPQSQSPRCSPPPEGGRGSSKEREGDANATADMCGGVKEETLVDSSVPPPPQQQHHHQHQQQQQQQPQQRLSELQRLKANCKPEELSKLRSRCEILVRDCIAGLLVNLSVQDFKEIEEELNRASCWYLTCDRYWEDSPTEVRASPWTLLALMGGMLAVGVVVCYYIIWVLFDSQEPWCDSPALSRRGPRAPWGGGPPWGSHGQMDPNADPNLGPQGYPDDDFYHGELSTQDDQYIYVTYPPDLKRRLMERPTPMPTTSTPASHHHHHQHHHHPQASQPMMTPHHPHHQHHHHYPMHQLHPTPSPSPSPHLSHVSQMSHMQHLAQMPRGSSLGHKQDPNPFEREWRI